MNILDIVPSITWRFEKISCQRVELITKIDPMIIFNKMSPDEFEKYLLKCT
ncbi:MAG: hypothetical protein U5N85_22860 [Arcicella sp.]|nr:hypothetical protein [Arcicella sp.]